MSTSSRDCQRTRELLSPLGDGELPLDLSGAVLAHLEGCGPCRSEADALRVLGAMVREVAEVAPAGLGARILGEARARQAATGRWRPRLVSALPRIAAVVAGAAAAATLLTPLTPAPIPEVSPRSPLHLLAFESQAELELAGSFGADFRVLARSPEVQLMYDIAGVR